MKDDARLRTQDFEASSREITIQDLYNVNRFLEMSKLPMMFQYFPGDKCFRVILTSKSKGSKLLRELAFIRYCMCVYLTKAGLSK